MNYDVQLYKLMNKFYEAYPQENYPELLMKPNRVYNCILFEFNEYFVCVPYRTEINHKYAYKFKRTERSKVHKSGLDFTKIVIVLNLDYIDSISAAIVDADEFKETREHIGVIQSRVCAYISDYIDYLNGYPNISKEEFNRRYKYSTLKYFHGEMGLST